MNTTVKTYNIACLVFKKIMKRFTKNDLDEYMKSDTILEHLNQNNHSSCYTSDQWLNDSSPKRMIYSYMYKEMFEADTKLKVLDVGGGYTGLTKIFLDKEYCLLDIMAHDDHGEFLNEEIKLGKKFWINNDWYEVPMNETYDLIIANDIFPNVDQRLEMFIEKFVPYCKSLRISLTFYDVQRFYKVKRMDADEIFFMMAWNSIQVKIILDKFKDRVINYADDTLTSGQESIFPNKRQIVMVDIQGDL